MDLRIEKTQKNIINAFYELRARKPLEKITVKELCEKAQINKSTFYSHFHDIYELSECLENELITSIMKDIRHPESILLDPGSFTREFFECYLVKDDLARILFSGTRSSLLIQKINQALKELVASEYPEYLKNPVKMIGLSYCIFGAYHAFIENREYGDAYVVNVISRLSSNFQNKAT